MLINSESLLYSGCTEILVGVGGVEVSNFVLSIMQRSLLGLKLTSAGIRCYHDSAASLKASTTNRRNSSF